MGSLESRGVFCTAVGPEEFALFLVNRFQTLACGPNFGQQARFKFNLNYKIRMRGGQPEDCKSQDARLLINLDRRAKLEDDVVMNYLGLLS